MKILIIEDENSLRQVMRRSLEKERYVVECAQDKAEAMARLGVYEYDCILLDIMLPDGSGLDLLAWLKAQRKQGRVVIISSKDSWEDKVEGLELGADDYLAKPFHLAELSARIRSVIRRNHNDADGGIRLGNVELLPAHFEARVDGRTLELNRKEYDILHYFMTRPERLVNKETIAEAVWGDHIDQTDNFDFIYAQIKNLRKKMRDAGATPQLKSAYGFGYKLTLNDIVP